MRERNRFLDEGTPGAPRIGIFAAARFPLIDNDFLYDQFRRIRRDVNATLFVFYSQLGNLQRLSGPLADLLDSGLFVRPLWHVHVADRHHWVTTWPQRVEQLIGELCEASGRSRGDLEESFDLNFAFTHARLAQALRLDVAVAWFPFDMSLNALVTARLLGIPHVLWLHGPQPANYPTRLLSLRLRASDQIVASGGVDLPRLRELSEAGTIRWHERERAENSVQWIADLVRSHDTTSVGGFEAAFPAARSPRRPPQAAPKPFIVIAAERTGSNLLTELLSSHPSIEMDGELFNTEFMDTGFIPSKDVRVQRDADLLDLRVRDVVAFLDRMWTMNASDATARVGFKVLYLHANANPALLEYVAESTWLDVIHLRRRNRLRRYVSRRRAQAVQIWWTDREAGQTYPTASPLHIDPEALVGNCEHIMLEEQKWEALLRYHATLDLYFEDIVADQAGTAKRLCAFLGVEHVRLSSPSQPTSEKSLERSIENYDVLRTALVGTPWERYLDD